MRLQDEHIVRDIDRIHQKSEAGRMSIPEVLAALRELHGPSYSQNTVSPSFPRLNCGSCIRFRCEVRSVTKEQVVAYSIDMTNGMRNLLLFRPESPELRAGNPNLLKVEAVSLGCVVHEPTTKAQTPVVVKIFDDRQKIRAGIHLEITGILTYKPSLEEQIRSRVGNRGPLAAILNHFSSNTNPLLVPRVHSIFHVRIPIV
ncbi:uncharacterized protein LOC100901316 [Galendromus occidentalis]|uniref:Uncharacterized protein LOC100901316 n=1 Tax=Galendromus occidentalis TaxID=34638 RepID=A0AAJ6VZB1_9ACAR|nr:uncharacterized protein LOC100901316 [Galendromus occidentalis]